MPDHLPPDLTIDWDLARELDRASQQRSKGPLVAVDLVMEQPILTVADVSERAQYSYNAAKRALDTLETLGIVKLMPPSHPQRWIAQELIDAVYDV